MGKKNADEMEFWTKDEFARFIEALKDRPASYAVFMTMYYTGIREGELLALTPADIDFAQGTLSINKSYQRMNGKDVITPPPPQEQPSCHHPGGFENHSAYLYEPLLRTSAG